MPTATARLRITRRMANSYFKFATTADMQQHLAAQ